MAARVGKYLLFETLGEGAYGKVKLGVHEDTGEQTAVKIMDKSDIQAMDMTVNVRREIAIMKALKHRNIVNLRQVLTSANKLYIVMELVKGGELFTKILNEGKIEEKLARKYFQEMVCGVEYCHRRGVFHRDLKPENLLIDESTGMLKITDFGLSAMKRDDDLLHTQVGSPNYCSPEVISKANMGYDGAKVDAWSCGVVLFALCTGNLPFFDEDTTILFQKILRSGVKYPKDFPLGARDVCERLLMKNPNERSSLAEIKKHPWFLIDFNLEEDEQASTVKMCKKAPKADKRDSENCSIGANKDSNPTRSTASPVACEAGSLLKAATHENAEIPCTRTEIAENSAMDCAASSGSASEDTAGLPPRGVEPPQSIENMSLRERVDWDITRYRHIFQLEHKQSLFASRSFKGELNRKDRSNDPKDITLRAKSITGAWAVNLAQQLLVCDEDGEFTVSIEEVFAFEELLDIWEARANEMEHRINWWENVRCIGPKESSHIMILLQVLDPRPAIVDLCETPNEQCEINCESPLSNTSATGPTSLNNSDLISQSLLTSGYSEALSFSTTELKEVEEQRLLKIRLPTIRRQSDTPKPTEMSQDSDQAATSPRSRKREKTHKSLLDFSEKIFGGRILQGGMLQFETDMPAPKALKLIGHTLMDQGAQVMMKRNENRLKCEQDCHGAALIVSIVAEDSSGKTVVTWKKARGAKLEKEFLDMYQLILSKFQE